MVSRLIVSRKTIVEVPSQNLHSIRKYGQRTWMHCVVYVEYFVCRVSAISGTTLCMVIARSLRCSKEESWLCHPPAHKGRPGESTDAWSMILQSCSVDSVLTVHTPRLACEDRILLLSIHMVDG